MKAAQSHPIEDIRIREIRRLTMPCDLLADIPCSHRARDTVERGRRDVANILHGRDGRLVVVVGPCSIHDVDAAMEFAANLAVSRERLSGALEIVMRVYFEKPRTTVGWKGLINDPHLDGSFEINEGLRLARRLLLQINELGLPAACEFLDTFSPQYIGDLVSWGAIGARTTESQVHRELASGLSCPVGFKNGVDGNVKIAVDAVEVAGTSHHFLGIAKDGGSAIVTTNGNPDCHVILRGGARPNFDSHSVWEASEMLRDRGLPHRLMVDASHGNSGKRPERQIAVCRELGMRLRNGEEDLMGVMVESNLVGGRQDLVPGKPLTYGQSITDGCLAWPETATLLEEMARSVEQKMANSDRRSA